MCVVATILAGVVAWPKHVLWRLRLPRARAKALSSRARDAFIPAWQRIGRCLASWRGRLLLSANHCAARRSTTASVPAC
eukprot:6771989-Prymnesium_polylepis.1